MHVFYQPDITADSIELSEEESKHCVRVLRMKKGDTVHLADGKGTHALALISDDNVKRCVLQIEQRTTHPSNRNYRLHIAIAPTKNLDRMEWFIEKATEVGIDEISFVLCTYSERNKINMDRCEKIAISAMKQSKQWWLPQINDMIPLAKFLATNRHGSKFIAWCDTDKTNQLTKTHVTDNVITMLIGPEGDFSAQETEQACAAGFTPVSLGHNILRTETAALYTCMAIKALRSD